MKNQQDYFDKILKILREIKECSPKGELVRHLSVATEDGLFKMTDKELIDCLTEYRNALESNTLADEDLDKIINETEDLFKEVEWDGELEEDED